MGHLTNLGKRFFHLSSITRTNIRVQGPSGWTGGEHHGGYKRFKYMAFINILVIGALSFVNLKEGKEHERQPFIKYEYMRMRSKRFPWGDGDRSLFHNPHVNALSTGYETEDPKHSKKKKHNKNNNNNHENDD